LSESLVECSLEPKQRLRVLGLHGAVLARLGRMEFATRSWETRLQIARKIQDWNTAVEALWDLEEGLYLSETHQFPGSIQGLIRGYVLRGRWHLLHENFSDALADADKAWEMLQQNNEDVPLNIYAIIGHVFFAVVSSFLILSFLE
jgi:hypothetical protein